MGWADWNAIWSVGMTQGGGGAGLLALLAELEDGMRAVGAGHKLELLRPGLDEAAVRGRLAPLGMAPPDEVVAWFGWRDGSDGHDVVRGFEFYSLDRAIWEYQQADLGEYDWQWRAGWLPLISPASMDRIVADCRAGGEAATVRCVSFDGGLFSDDSERSSAQSSLTVMISWWLDAIRAGIYVWDAVASDWTWDRFNQIPLERRGLS